MKFTSAQERMKVDDALVGFVSLACSPTETEFGINTLSASEL
jgi:hypothetical protein